MSLGSSLIDPTNFMWRAGRLGCTIGLIVMGLFAFNCYHFCDSTNSWIHTQGTISVNTPTELGTSFYVHRKMYYTRQPHALSLYLSFFGFKLPRFKYEEIDYVPQPPPGTLMDVYYNPQNPSQAVTEKGTPGLFWVALFCYGALSALHTFAAFVGWKDRLTDP